ncbi:MAG: hypothetical protein ACOCZQ_01140 [Nanoarchaeota archaeon]
MNKNIIFDSGPVISLTLNNLLWLLKPLKEKCGGEFYISPAIYNELIKKPLSTKKYKFEALQILPYIMDGTLRYHECANIKEKTRELLDIANSCFIAKGNYVSIVHRGEMEAVATALSMGSETLIIDERTTRLLIECPHSLLEYLQKKLHTNIDIERDNVDKLENEIGHLKVIRSFELGIAAFELGLLDKYMLKEEENLDEVKDIRSSLLEGVLWAIKLSGCSVSRDDIDCVLDVENNSH